MTISDVYGEKYVDPCPTCLKRIVGRVFVVPQMVIFYIEISRRAGEKKKKESRLVWHQPKTTGKLKVACQGTTEGSLIRVRVRYCCSSTE